MPKYLWSHLAECILSNKISKMKKINLGLIECEFGNIGSLKAFFNVLGNVKVKPVKTPSDLIGIDVCILPGVGHFGAVMNGIDKLKLRHGIINFANSGNLLIGICAGAQVLLEHSDESEEAKGLNLISGFARSLKLNNLYKDRIPRIGWQHTKWSEENLKKLGLMQGESCYYFAHSYELCPVNRGSIASVCNDGVIAAIAHNNIWGLQFHPEKSQDDGIHIINSIIKKYA